MMFQSKLGLEDLKVSDKQSISRLGHTQTTTKIPKQRDKYTKTMWDTVFEKSLRTMNNFSSNRNFPKTLNTEALELSKRPFLLFAIQ